MGVKESQLGALVDGSEFLGLRTSVVRLGSDQLLALALLDDMSGPT